MNKLIYLILFLLLTALPLCAGDGIAPTRDLSVVSFPDIHGHWAQKYFEAMATVGLARGNKGTDFFSPESYITREEAAILFLTAAGIVPPLTEKSSFQDVYAKYWAAPYIEEAVRRGYISGYQKDAFLPKAIINRTEGVLMAANFAGIKASYLAKSVAPDLPLGYWANKYLFAAYQKNFFPPDWNLKKGFYPLKPITRAEMYYMLSRARPVRDKIEEVLGREWFNTDELYLPELGEDPKKDNSVQEDRSAASAPKEAFSCEPSEVKPGEYVWVKINSKKIENIAKVRFVKVDLSPIGRMSENIALDDGRWGDQTARDGIYTLKAKIFSSAIKGKKALPIQVMDENKRLWQGRVILTII
jgi:hypothetical protein